MAECKHEEGARCKLLGLSLGPRECIGVNEASCPLALLAGRAKAAEADRDAWRRLAGRLEAGLRDLGYNTGLLAQQLTEEFRAVATAHGGDGRPDAEEVCGIFADTNADNALDQAKGEEARG